VREREREVKKPQRGVERPWAIVSLAEHFFEKLKKKEKINFSVFLFEGKKNSFLMISFLLLSAF
jgi:hypothetical protein